jgi:signal peptidase I
MPPTQSRRNKIIIALLVAVIAANLFRAFVMEGFIVRGDSMDPTIPPGSYIFVNKFAYVWGEPKRGDIIVVTPRDNPTKIIKRIVGLPGEIVSVEDGRILIRESRDEHVPPLAEEYVKAGYTPGAGFDHTRLDPGEYFAMGDNRQVSIDSRELGPVDSWDIRGRVFAKLDLSKLTFHIY